MSICGHRCVYLGGLQEQMNLTEFFLPPKMMLMRDCIISYSVTIVPAALKLLHLRKIQK